MHHKSISLSQVDTSTVDHVHQIQALGMEPSQSPVAYARKCINNSSPKYPDLPIAFKFTYPSIWLMIHLLTSGLHRWNNPSVYHYLLKELPQNAHRRVASFCHIVARPMDSSGVLKGKVNTLTII